MRLSLALLIGAVACFNFNSASAADKIKVLLVTGDDVGSHNWKQVAPATRDILVGSGKFDVKITETQKELQSASELEQLRPGLPRALQPKPRPSPMMPKRTCWSS